MWSQNKFFTKKDYFFAVFAYKGQKGLKTNLSKIAQKQMPLTFGVADIKSNFEMPKRLFLAKVQRWMEQCFSAIRQIPSTKKEINFQISQFPCKKFLTIFFSHKTIQSTRLTLEIVLSQTIMRYWITNFLPYSTSPCCWNSSQFRD